MCPNCLPTGRVSIQVDTKGKTDDGRGKPLTPRAARNYLGKNALTVRTVAGASSCGMCPIPGKAARLLCGSKLL